MHETTPEIHDVVIAGAGPVGLFLACELRLAGTPVLVLERSSEPDSPFKRAPFGIRGLSATTLDALSRRGLLRRLVAQQEVDPGGGIAAGAHWTQQARRPGGHFAGLQFPLDLVDSFRWPYHRRTAAETSMPTTMAHLEAVLTEQAEALGVDVRRGLGVDGIESFDEEVRVHAGGERVRARWLVGCDGGRSAVRKAAGFDFVGTEPEFTGYSVQVALSDGSTLAPGRHYTPTGMYTFQPPGTVAMVAFDGGARHRARPITLDHVQEVLRDVSGTEVDVTSLELATTWTDRAFQATAYRRGRVLLAGDAAHIHSPLGGQGLNLGLGDAMNLGWKLAAVIRGDAPHDLLDSYASERHPVGAKVLDWSRAQVALMRPGAGSRALAAIVRDLIETRDGATYCAERVWGVSLRYDLGDGHPLQGHSAPDFQFSDGTRLSGLLESGRGVLLDLDASAPLRSLADRWKNRITYAAGTVVDRLDLTALLVRPDGFVAWATETTADPAEVARAASRWFGEADVLRSMP